MIDFAVPVSARRFLDRLDAFVAEHVLPAEDGCTERDFADGRVEQEVLPALRSHAREAGVFAPQLPPDLGGQGLGITTLALVAERCGPHPLASLAINMMAPDEANLHLLLHYGDPTQQERWLRPLAEGVVRSCFGMTEPDAGADPRRIRSRAERTPAGWRINAHKVFTTGGIGAAFCVVVAVSDPQAPPGRGLSMYVVPTDAAGFEVVRDMETMGFHSLGGHPEIKLHDVEVGDDAVLGGLGAGLAMAQSRLAIGRVGHAMRWIGIGQRCLDLAAGRAQGRETFGAALADRQAVQWWLADGATLLYASRLMVLNVCWRLENEVAHRTQVSMLKTFVAEALGEIVDKALQVYGGWGYTKDYPLEQFYRDARAARIYDGPSEVHRMLVARAVLEEVAERGTAARACGDLLGDHGPA